MRLFEPIVHIPDSHIEVALVLHFLLNYFDLESDQFVKGDNVVLELHLLGTVYD